jgi:SSS family solute:Na+ symporter
MPEFLERRFSVGSRYLLSVVSLITFVLSKIAVGIFAGGVVFATLLPEVHLQIGSVYMNSFWVGSIAVILLTGLYTMLGGMRAVAYNDAIQCFVLILGSGCLTAYGLMKLGGWQELRHICGSEMFNLWKPLIPDGMVATWEPVKESQRMAWYFNSYFPWLGMLFCAPIIGLWYWCTDQYIVQRVLGAVDESNARRGSIFAAFLKLFPVYLFIVPGLIAFALAKSGKVPGLNDMIGHDGKVVAYAAQAAFPMMVKYLLPAGLRGLVVAGLLSALMGSLAGVFNACATLFTVDLYEKWKPKATQHQIVRTGRIATAVMIVVALLWIPVIQGAHGLYGYLQSVQGYLAPPVFVVFFLGVFFKRLNAQGCFWAMVVGFAIGLFRMAVDTPVTLGLPGFEHGYPQGSFLWIVNNIYFQYFSVLITLISAIVMVAVSLATKCPDDNAIAGLAFGTLDRSGGREPDLRSLDGTGGLQPAVVAATGTGGLQPALERQTTLTLEREEPIRVTASHCQPRDWRAIVGSAVVVVAIMCAYLYFRG